MTRFISNTSLKSILFSGLLHAFFWIMLQFASPMTMQGQHLLSSPPDDMRLNFITYTKNDGLPHSSVWGFLQDSKHFIWFISGGGLSRFDGVEFQNFIQNPKDTNSIASTDVRSVCEMPGDLIFIGTSNGLCVYNNRLNRFENWRIKEKEIKPGSNTVIFSLSVDPQKNLWINYKGVLDVYDSVARFKFRYTDTEEGKVLKGITTAQTCFPTDNSGNMWMNKDNFGLVCIDSITHKATCFKNTNNPVFIQDAIQGIYIDNEKSICWYTAWGKGLFRYDLKTKKLKQYLFNRSSAYRQDQRNVVNYLLHYRKYLLCATEDGLVVFNTLDESYHVLTHNDNDPFSIPCNTISSIMIDRNNQLWLGTEKGVCRSNLDKNRFDFISGELSGTNTGQAIEINHFAVYQSEWLIVGTVRDGLFSYNLKTHERRHYPVKPPKMFGENFFGKVFIDRNNTIWVSCYDGLRIYDLKNNRMLPPPGNLNGLNPTMCITFYQDTKLDYWMSFEGDPKLIHVVHDGNSTYRVIKYFHDNGNFPLMKINGIREDTAANIWISSTWSLGFLKWSRSDNSFTRYPKVKTPDEYLSESMYDLLPAQGTSLWLASGAGHGLISYDYATNQQHSFTTDDGLICNNLVSLFRHKNKLWISTVDGLSEFDPNTKIFTGFGLTDGLPETDFARKFVYDSAMNRLYASTPHYVIYFNPDSVVQNKASEPASDIYLQKFRVNGNTVYHDFTKQLDLSPGENNVNMEFSCIDFIHGEKIKFEYQLEGLETRWNPSEKRRFVNYTNLFPGSYRFKVRTINEEGNPGSTIILASFTVGTPFYFTWWFILLVIIVAASLMIMVNSFRNRSRKALMEVRERISRDLHDDIGSTLNSLSIYSEIAKIKNTEESQRDKFLDIIGQSSRNMIEQMNDIVWTVNPLNDKFEHILLRMRSFASEMTEGRNVSLKFEVDKACKSISLGMNERKNFYLIFKEAVNNAMKYSGATEVIVRIRMPENQLTLEICDNGSGFDPVSQPGDNLTLGGNGLRNMKIRAEEIRAGLKIDTRTGSGTRIVLSLKI